MHNGTISNMWKLCQTYDIPFNSWDVDSHGLGLMIDKAGPIVLNDYDGYAALIWTTDKNPNSLFVYHGKFCQYKTDAEKDAEVERPLFFLPTPEGIYFSSMASSLFSIVQEGQKIDELNHNIVFEARNGDFSKYRFNVDRLYGPNTKEKYTYTGGRNSNNTTPNYAADDYDELGYGCNGMFNHNTYNHNNGRPKNGNAFGEWIGSKWVLHVDNPNRPEYIPRRNDLIINPKNEIVKVNSTINAAAPLISKIWEEARPLQGKEIPIGEGKYDRIFFWKGRFHNSHGTLVNGVQYVTAKGIIRPKDDTGAYETYFYRGVMLKGAISYKEVMEIDANPSSSFSDPKTNFAHRISQWSLYPVTNYYLEGSDLHNYLRFAFYKDKNRLKEGTFNVKHSSRTYHINKNGFLVDITTSDKKKDKVIFETAKKEEEAKIVYEIGDSNYDKIFASTEIALNNLTDMQQLALRDFCKDYMTKNAKASGELEPDDTEATEEAFKIIQEAVATKVTIREMIEDADHALEIYEDCAKEAEEAKKPKNEEEFLVIKEMILKGDHWVTETGEVLTNKWTKIGSIQSVVRNGKTVFTKESIEIIKALAALELEEQKKTDVEEINDAVVVISDEEKEAALDIFDQEIIRNSVREKMDNIIVSLSDIINQTDELDVLIDDKLAQDVSETLYTFIMNIKHNLADLAQEHKEDKIVYNINKSLNVDII